VSEAGLPIVAYAWAGASAGPLREARRAQLPPQGPQPRSARLPDLATALVRRALEGGPALPPEASVLFGTALGCVTETAAFLENMIREAEALPLPRAFAASVHNAVASRVALAIGARGECQTFVHGEVSFAQALFAALRRRARGERGPVIVGAADEAPPHVALARRALGCPDADAEGGAVLLCGDAEGRPPLAWVRRAAFARPRDPLAWLATQFAATPADALFLDLPPEHALESHAALLTVDARRLVGGHPSGAAVAAALAVALVSGEVDAGALSLEATPRTVAVVSASRFGDVGLVVVSRADA